MTKLSKVMIAVGQILAIFFAMTALLLILFKCVPVTDKNIDQLFYIALAGTALLCLLTSKMMKNSNSFWILNVRKHFLTVGILTFVLIFFLKGCVEQNINDYQPRLVAPSSNS